MVKLPTAIKNMNVESVSISFRRTSLKFTRRTKESTHPVQSAAKLHTLITITNTILTIVVVIKNVITHFLYASPLQFHQLQCRSCLVKMISNVCDTALTLFCKP